jgi:hypothetical protein
MPNDKPVKRRGSYKPKNQLDYFLERAYKGKYKHLRYAKFLDYLIQERRMTPEAAAAHIIELQESGISPVIESHVFDDIRSREASLRKAQGVKAVTTRWEKRKKSENFKNCTAAVENCTSVSENRHWVIVNLPFCI